LPVARSSFRRKTSQPDATSSALSRSPTPLPLYKSSIPLKLQSVCISRNLKLCYTEFTTISMTAWSTFAINLMHVLTLLHDSKYVRVCNSIITAVMVMYRRCWHIILTVRMETADYLLLVVFLTHAVVFITTVRVRFTCLQHIDLVKCSFAWQLVKSSIMRTCSSIAAVGAKLQVLI